MDIVKRLVPWLHRHEQTQRDPAKLMTVREILRTGQLHRAVEQMMQTGLIAAFPPGMTADNSAVFGLMALMQNLNSYAESPISVATSGTNVTLTGAQVIAGVTKLTTGASGGFTITLAATSAIITAMGNTIPLNGTYSEPVSFLNFNIGQTGTVTVGDASTTLNTNGGASTIATNTRRAYFLTVASATTITLDNVGSLTL
jgi:hypothetical protein